MTISLLIISAAYFTTLVALTGISKMSHTFERISNQQTNPTKKEEDITKDFQDQWDRVRLLGRGGDGIVHCYQQKTTGHLVAVKEPVWDNGDQLDEGLLDEIHNLKTIGQHPNIISMLGFRFHFVPRGPAIVFQYCELGDLNQYRKRWIDQAKTAGLPARVSEDTLWQLLHDMALALDYLHNKLEKRWIHTDVKPGNILVLTPPGYEGEGIPEQPSFKLADFSRLTSYPSSDTLAAQTYGTYEFRPPLDELAKELVHPASDMWSLGATLQCFAFGFQPIESRKAYIDKLVSHSIFRPHPLLPSCEEGWGYDVVRANRPVVFRPLDVSMDELTANHDVPFALKDYSPFSAELNEWNGMLMMLSRQRRITASVLAAEVVPLVLAKKDMKKLKPRRADSLHDEPERKPLKRQPSYEGNDYGSPSDDFVVI
jgi:serine/threonine protein kinase